MANHIDSVSEYTLSLQGVLFAGQRLRTLIDAEPARQQYAVRQLTRAVEHYDDGGTAFRNFMFSEIEATDESETDKRERISEDVLALALGDIEVANVLIASGRALGEEGEKVDPRELDNALLRLESASRLVQEPLATDLDAPLARNRFGFAEEGAAEPRPASASLDESIDRYHQSAEQTLADLITESGQVLSKVFQSVKKLDGSKILEALDNLGRSIPALGKLTGLIKWGLKKLYSALDVLIGLVGKETLEQIKAKAKQMWEKVSSGEYVQPVLEWAYGKDATLAYIKEKLPLAGSSPPTTPPPVKPKMPQPKQIDDAALELEALVFSFRENMAVAGAIGSGISVAASLLAFTSLAGPNLALVTGCALVTLMGVVMLIGMDYADSEKLLRRVRGVRTITDSLGSGEV